MAASTLTGSTWSAILAARDGHRSAPLSEPWCDLFGPLIDSARWTVAQLGQSLDGRIATRSGHSHYVNGPEAIRHLHRLRALADAVVVGVGTALADDPRLTVRGIDGRSPARAVIDPNRRLPATARLLAADGVPCVVIVDRASRSAPPGRAEAIALAADANGRIAPRDIIDALRARGWQRLLIEGGAATVSNFLAERCLDRLHLAVAPLLIGSGPIGVNLPAIDTLDQAMRPPVRHFALGDDLLFDVDLRGSRGAQANVPLTSDRPAAAPA